MADKGYEDVAVVSDARERSVGEHIFIWVAWALAAVAWGASLTIFAGILRETSLPSPAPVAAGVWTGAVYFLSGVGVLGLAIAFGALASARRNRRLDPVTEAATARLYDAADRQGGEDQPPSVATRSPPSTRPGRRAAPEP